MKNFVGDFSEQRGRRHGVTLHPGISAP
jgi:hypothetical protein